MMKPETMARRIRELEKRVRELEVILEADTVIAFFKGIAAAPDEQGV